MMKKIGMIFPGQGSQLLGMGKDLHDKHRLVQEYFEEASNCLDQNFIRLCFSSSERELKETINAQTSIFLVSAAIVSLLKEKYNITPSIVAGHSCGEYAALFAAGGITFTDALYLLKKRASFMDEATKKHKGGMLAVINVPYNTLQDICKSHDDETNERVAEMVNINSSSQFVVSGTIPELEQIANEIKIYGGKAIMLNVDGAFHSRLMKEAADLFALYLVKVDFKELTIPLVNNVDAAIIRTPEEIKTSIKNQMASPVRWRESLERFADCDIILEIGSDDKLAKMLSREWPDKQILSIHTEQDIEKLLTILEKDVVKREHHESCDKKNCALEELIVIDNTTPNTEIINKCSGEQDIILPETPAPVKAEATPDITEEVASDTSTEEITISKETDDKHVE